MFTRFCDSELVTKAASHAGGGEAAEKRRLWASSGQEVKLMAVYFEKLVGRSV